MPITLKGLYTVLITPFRPDGSLNEEGLRRLIRFQLEHKVDGIGLLGTTSETPTLSRHEKERIIKIGVEEVKGLVPLVIGTGSYSTSQTIEETRLAEKLGADAALIVTPYYNRPTQEGIFRHFKAVSEATSFPICLYNIPIRTGQNINLETIKRLATIPSVVGIKEASGHIGQIADVMTEVCRARPNFTVLSGDDSLVLPLMALGGHGVFSVVSNLIPRVMRSFVNACESGDFKLAQAFYYQLSPLFKGAFLETNPVPIKTAMNFCGMPAGSCRLPLCEMSAENEQKLRQIITDLPKEWLM